MAPKTPARESFAARVKKELRADLEARHEKSDFSNVELADGPISFTGTKHFDEPLSTRKGRKGRAHVVESLSTPEPSSLDGLKRDYLNALWRNARAKRVLSGANDKVKSSEVAVVEARRHRLPPGEVEEVQEELAKSLEARTEAKMQAEQRKGELKHAWEAYGAFEEEA